MPSSKYLWPLDGRSGAPIVKIVIIINALVNNMAGRIRYTRRSNTAYHIVVEAVVYAYGFGLFSEPILFIISIYYVLCFLLLTLVQKAIPFPSPDR